jgi:hypothetical protein
VVVGLCVTPTIGRLWSRIRGGGEYIEDGRSWLLAAAGWLLVSDSS